MTDTRDEISQLFNNTDVFLNENVVDTFRIIAPEDFKSGVSSFMLFRLEEITQDGSSTSPRRFYLKAVPETKRGPSTRDAYYLAFHGRGQFTIPGFVNIPANPKHPSMLFTGTLSGCSVIVTRSNENLYRVYHDARCNSSALYDNVVASIDLRDYHDQEGAFATVCMSNSGEGNEWRLHAQFLDFQNGGVHFRKPNQQRARVLTRLMQPDRQPATVQNAQAERDIIFEKMKHLARYPGPSNKDAHAHAIAQRDGDFDENTSPIKLTDKAVRRTQELARYLGTIRDKLKEKIKDYPKNSEMRGIWEVDVKNYDDMISRCDDNDKVYLWLRLKLAKGFDAVVSTEGRIMAGFEGDTVGERFAPLEVQMKSAPNAAFAEGYTSYTTVKVPGIDDTMTSLEMKALLMVSLNSLEDKQLGALLRRIEVAAETETRTRVWNRADAVVRYLLKDSTKVQPMPQDVLAVFQERVSSAHCYPLVRAAAVALWDGGTSSVDQIMAKLVSLRNTSDANFLNAKLMLDGLEEVRGNWHATAASTLRGRGTLEQAVDALIVEGGAKSKIVAMNTREHAMLLGVTVRNSETAYHFYDPNFAMATFASKESLLKALNRHLVTETFASTYSAFGTAETPTFNLVEIDAWEMSRVDIGSQLTLRDLSSDETLVETASSKWRRNPVQASRDLVDKPSFHGTRALSEALQATKAWREAVAALEKAYGLDGPWMPILQNLEPETGGGYRVQFINIEDPSQTRWLSTNDEEIVRFRSLMDERLKALARSFEYARGSLARRSSALEVEAVDGLNAMFVIKTLIEELSDKPGAVGLPSHGSTLATALQVHSYLNMAQLTHGTLQDAKKVADLARALVEGEKTGQRALTGCTRALGRGLGAASEVAGTIFAVANVVLDVVELAHAENEEQKAVFMVHLAFDSLSLGVAAGATAAGIVGASTLSGVLGGLMVPLAGLGIAFGGLAEALGKVASNAAEVGRYFGDAEDAYKNGAYTLVTDDDAKVLMPKRCAVISQVDLITREVLFDSQYIYRTRVTGGLWWAGTTTIWDPDRSKALNVRKKIGIQSDSCRLPVQSDDDFECLVLPPTPKSYIWYAYNYLPFSTWRGDYGFDVLRRMEGEGEESFLFDFFRPPVHWIIDKITHQYVDTPVTIALASHSLRIQIPPLPYAMHSSLSYTLKGAGGAYSIGLEKIGGITLSSSASTTKWLLDARTLSSPEIEFRSKYIIVSGIRITVSDTNYDVLLALLSNGETLKVDIQNETTTTVKIDAGSYPQGSAGVDDRLRDLERRNQLQGQFVVVDNYDARRGPNDTKTQNVGRAFYEVSKARMLFTRNAPAELTKTAELAGVIDDVVYFYSIEHKAIWRVNAKIEGSKAKYNALFKSSKMSLKCVWMEGNLPHAIFHHTLSDGIVGELNYIISAKDMTLVSIGGNPALMDKLAGMTRLGGSIRDLLDAFKASKDTQSVTDNLEGIPVYADTEGANIVMVFGKDGQGTFRRFWIRKVDRQILKPVLEDSEHVVLAAILPPAEPGGPDETYFYHHGGSELYRYTLEGKDLTPKTIQMKIPDDFGALENVVTPKGMNLMAVTKGGFLLRVTSPGVFTPEAVNETWVQAHDPRTWWSELDKISDKFSVPTMAIFGIRDDAGRAVPMWYHHGGCVIASEELHGKSVQLVGFHSENAAAWLSAWDAPGRFLLFSQPVTDRNWLEGQVGIIRIPPTRAAVRVKPLTGVASVVPTEAGPIYTTLDGVSYLLRADMSRTAVGVTRDWQLKHGGNMLEALARLTKPKLHPAEVLFLRKAPPGTPVTAWFSPLGSHIVKFTPPGVSSPADLLPTWLGCSLDGTLHYVHCRANGDFYGLVPREQTTTTKKLGNFPLFRRKGDAITVSLLGSSFKIPMLRNVRYVGVAADPGSTVRFTNETWKVYDAVSISTTATPSKPLAIHFPSLVYPERLTAVSGASDDLVIVDSNVGTSLTLTGAEKTGNGDAMVLEGMQGDDRQVWTVSVARILKARAWFKAEYELDGTPLMTLKEVLGAPVSQ
ncbi:TcdA/TcdB toxin- pore forming domain-containing protein [Apiospora arundinis]